MAITENKIEDMLRNTVFTDSNHKEAVRKKLSSGIVELSRDELELVTGGAGVQDEFRLIDESLDEFFKW